MICEILVVGEIDMTGLLIEAGRDVDESIGARLHG